MPIYLKTMNQVKFEFYTITSSPFKKFVKSDDGWNKSKYSKKEGIENNIQNFTNKGPGTRKMNDNN